MKRTLMTFGLLALLAANPASAQLDMTQYVALGDSFTAGFVNGGLVDCYQMNSFPAILANQANAPSFEMPLISPPGVPPILELASLAGGIPILVPAGELEDAFPYNVTYELPYNNLGVPGATLYDLLFQIGDLANLAAGDLEHIMFDLILRIPQIVDPGTGDPVDFTAVVQAVALQPTFVTMWIGYNDVLPGVYTATPIEGVTMTPVDTFAFLYPQAVGALVTQTAADIVLFTVPDPSETAFATTVPPFLEIPGVGVVPIMGSNGPLSADSLVTLPASALLAQGYGIPFPGYPPLPEDLNLITGEPGYVLRPDEVAAVRDQVAAFNQIIVATAAQFGLPVFDAADIFHEAYTEGVELGAVTFDGSYLTGGLISYDGLHPQQFGHWALATALVEFLNDTYGAGIEPIDLSSIMFTNPCSPLPTPFYGIDPATVIFSPESRQYLDMLFMPELPKAGPAPRREATTSSVN